MKDIEKSKMTSVVKISLPRIAALTVAATAAFAAQGAGITGAGVVEQESKQFDGVVAADGAIQVLCPNPDGWRFSLDRTAEAEAGIDEWRLTLTRAAAAEPPEFTVEVRSPKTDMQYSWTPVFGCNGRIPLPGWTKWFAVQRSLPIIHRFNGGNRNRLTISVGEVRRDLETSDGIDEYDFNVIDRIKFFKGVKGSCTEYSVQLCTDRRDVFWSDAVSDAAKWIAAKSRAPAAMKAPDCAYRPLYSTWYNHHHDISAEKIDKELALASALGMETVILDAGWQWPEDAPGFSVAGDWEVASNKFPDMAAHIRKAHDLGMKYMMWYAVPFVGYKVKAYDRFEGKYLYKDERNMTACLDPRFPEVREHLAATCEKAMKDWNLDGLKLDFIDQIETRGRPDPAVAENFAGRDVKTVPEGVELLMTEITRRVRAVKSDAMIEFRSAYFGPVMQSCGNMMRVADCPGQLAANRVGTVNLRLSCPGSCVHGDMIGWPKEASVEEAARYVLSSIFGTVQYSVVLDGLDERKTAMLRHWIAFSKKHLAALQKGTLHACHPEYDFPVIEGCDESESVILVSAAGFAAEVPGDVAAFVLNNTGTDKLILDLPAARSAVVRDTCGRRTGVVSIPEGVSEVTVPPSGYLEFHAPLIAGPFADAIAPWNGEVMGVHTNGGIVRVDYALRPTDKSYIRCQLLMPPKDKWSGRFWGQGNGGQAGGRPRAMPAFARAGDAVAHTDMGSSEDRAYGNPEAWTDFAHRATHLMTLSAKALIEANYGSAPRFSYFYGASTGGNQGLMEAERYPEDYDGVLSIVPAFARIPYHVKYVWNARQVFRPDGTRALTDSQIATVEQAALEWFAQKEEPHARGRYFTQTPWSAGDMDGVLALAAIRDPSIADEDVKARFRAIWDGPVINGRRAGLGLPPGARISRWLDGKYTSKESWLWNWLSNRHRPLLSISDDELEEWAKTSARQFNATNPGLSRFFARGGVLLMTCGAEDDICEPGPMIAFANEVIARNPYAAQRSFRFYLNPGRAHGNGHRGLCDLENMWSKLVSWREKGVAPDVMQGVWDWSQKGFPDDVYGGKSKDPRRLPVAPWPEKMSGSDEAGWRRVAETWPDGRVIDPVYFGWEAKQ